MKLNHVFASLLISSQLISHENYQHIGFKADSRDASYTQLNLEHQTHLEFKDDNFAILSLGYKPFLNKTHHFEGGLGYRKFFRDNGFGLNLVYAASNRSKVYLHQLSPGVELFAGKYQLSANHYLPLKKQASYKGGSILHHAVSEFGITYRASNRMEIGVMPFFNHGTKNWGYNSSILLTFQDSLQIGLHPFYKNGGHGFLFSFGVAFGGKRDNKTQPIRKTNDFFFTRERPEAPKARESFVPPFVPESPVGVFIPLVEVKVDQGSVKEEKEVIEPVVVKPVEQEVIAPVPEPIPDVKEPEPKPTPPKSWWKPDFIGVWPAMISNAIEEETPTPKPTVKTPYDDPKLAEWVDLRK
jgi:hypothetical protein